jgi:hypothetical protein
MTDLPTTAEGWNEHIRKNREKQKKEELERKAAAEKNAARGAWINDGGTEGEFEKAWPQMRRERHEAKVREEQSRLAERAKATVKSSF